MTCRVGILRPECRAESIHISHGKGIDLRLKLSAYGKVGRASEKILLKIHATFLFGDILQVKGSHLEHSPCPFAVAPRNYRGMDIEEAPFLKKSVDRHAHGIPDPGNSAECIGPGPQMRDCPQELEGVPLLLQGIRIRIRPAHDAVLLLSSL